MSRGNRISMRNTVKLNMVELKDESEEDQNFTNSKESITESEQPDNDRIMQEPKALNHKDVAGSEERKGNTD